MERGDVVYMNNEITRYRDYLGEIYDESEVEKMMILKTMISIYPVFKQSGLGFTAPVALITNTTQQSKRVIKDLSGFVPCKLVPTDISKKELRETLTEAEYELIPFYFMKGKGSILSLCEMNSFCVTEDISNEDISRVVMVVFSGGIPSEACEHLAGKLHIRTGGLSSYVDNPASKEYLNYMINYVKSNVSMIRKIINDMMRTGFSQESSGSIILRITGAVYRSMVEDLAYSSGIKDEYNANREKAVKELCDEWEIGASDENWIMQFQKLFYKAAEWMPGILEREHVMADEIEKLEYFPMYDSKYYYLPESLFYKICEPILGTVALDEIKDTLEENDIIKGEGKMRNYRTVKVYITTVYGGEISRRRIRLVRTSLDQEGLLSWCEMIKAEKGGEKDDDCYIR